MIPLQAHIKLEGIAGSEESEVKQAVYRNGEGKLVTVCSIRSPYVAQGCFQGNTFAEAFTDMLYHMKEMGIKRKDNPSIQDLADYKEKE